MSLHGEALRTEFRVFNTDKVAWDFTAALHSYLEVLDISKARVKGLSGVKYLDKVPACPAGASALTPCSAKEARAEAKHTHTHTQERGESNWLCRESMPQCFPEIVLCTMHSDGRRPHRECHMA